MSDTDRAFCSGDWRVDFEHGWMLVHDLTPEQANTWRLLPWPNEIRRIRYPLDCETPFIAQRYGMDDTYTWYHEKVSRGAVEYGAQGVVRRTGERVNKDIKSFVIVPPFIPYYADVMPS